MKSIKVLTHSYLVLALLALLTACASQNKVKTSQVPAVVKSAKVKQNSQLTLAEQFKVLRFARMHRTRCLEPLADYYSQLSINFVGNGAGEKQDKPLPGPAEIRTFTDKLLAKMQQNQDKQPIVLPDIKLSSSVEVTDLLVKSSDSCYAGVLDFIDNVATTYELNADTQSDHSTVMSHFSNNNLKNELMRRTYAFETNEYRLAANGSLYSQDDYTYFMYKVYSALSFMNKQLKADSMDSVTERKALAANYLKALELGLEKVKKEFKVLGGLSFMLRLQQNKALTLPVDKSDDIIEQAFIKQIDSFYPTLVALLQSLGNDSFENDSAMIDIIMLDTALIAAELQTVKLRADYIAHIYRTITKAAPEKN